MRNNKQYRSEADQIVSRDSSELLDSDGPESSEGLFSRLKSSLRRRLGGFDINGDGSIDIQEHDAKRLAASHGFKVDNSLAFSTSPDFPARGTVDLHEIESLAREHGWNRAEATPVAQTQQPLFEGLQANIPRAPAQPGLDAYWDNNMGNKSLPKTSVGNMSINEDALFLKKNIKQQAASNIYDSSFAFEVNPEHYSKNSFGADKKVNTKPGSSNSKKSEDHFAQSKPRKGASKFDQFIEKILTAILGAILGILGFKPSRNDQRSKKLQKFRKDYR